MGKKNCELAPEDIQRICDTFLAFEETEQSKIFPNAAFGYWKVKVERPLRLHSQLTRSASRPCASPRATRRSAPRCTTNSATPCLTTRPPSARNWSVSSTTGKKATRRKRTARRIRDAAKKPPGQEEKEAAQRSHLEARRHADRVATRLRETLGDGLFEDHNVFLDRVEAALKELGLKPSAAERKLIVNAVSWRVEDAPPVIKKIHKPGKAQPDPLRGLFERRHFWERGRG
jgi:type I restriction enzyme M protein